MPRYWVSGWGSFTVGAFVTAKDEKKAKHLFEGLTMPGL